MSKTSKTIGPRWAIYGAHGRPQNGRAAMATAGQFLEENKAT